MQKKKSYSSGLINAAKRITPHPQEKLNRPQKIVTDNEHKASSEITSKCETANTLAYYGSTVYGLRMIMINSQGKNTISVIF